MPPADHPNLVTVDSLDHENCRDRRNFAADVARAVMALEAGRMGSWSHHIPENEVWGDRIVAELLGFDYAAQPWSAADFFQSVHPSDRQRVACAIRQAYSGDVPFYDVEVRRNLSAAQERHLGGERWVGARARVTERDADGNPVRVIGVNWDVTETKRTEQRLAMLAGEMDHRVKNAFAVIRALVNLGEDLSSDKARFAATLRTQVEAMATAHMLSAKMARSTSNSNAEVALSEIFETALAPWIHANADDQTRVSLDCDPAVMLPPVKVAAFAMMLYELSTNATKHGPLGEIGGSLNVTVSQDAAGGIKMTWIESLQRPLNTSDHDLFQKGFGEVLMNHCVNSLHATVRREITRSGFQLDMYVAPLDG